MENNFGKFLSEKRKEVGLTQKQLAEKMFVSESAVSKWEKNKANPDISMIPELATILNVSEHELITASVDHIERKTKKDAHKWKMLSNTWNLFFLILYGIALLTCFICNLAVNGTLSWFWIVASAVLLGMSFTTIPQYIKKYKLLYITIVQLLSLILLFAVCCIYTRGSWFWLATIPTLTAFIIVFFPIYISKYNVPKILKENNGLISVLVDIILIIVMEGVVCCQTGGSWFWSFALPITLYCSIIPISFVIICCYTKITKLLKASILTFLFIPFFIGGYFITTALCQKVFKITIDEIQFPNFLNWSTNIAISSNVIALILISIFLTSLILLIINFCKKNKI